MDDGRSQDQNRSGARSALDISLHLLAGSFLHQLSYSPKGFTILHRSIDSGAEVTSVARYEDFEAVGRKEHESCRKHCLAVRKALLGRAGGIAWQGRRRDGLRPLSLSRSLLSCTSFVPVNPSIINSVQVQVTSKPSLVRIHKQYLVQILESTWVACPTHLGSRRSCRGQWNLAHPSTRVTMTMTLVIVSVAHREPTHDRYCPLKQREDQRRPWGTEKDRRWIAMTEQPCPVQRQSW